MPCTGPQRERFLDLFLKRDPQAGVEAATTKPSFHDDLRLSLEDGPEGPDVFQCSVIDQARHAHQPPLSAGDRSNVTGDALRSEYTRES